MTRIAYVQPSQLKHDYIITNQLDHAQLFENAKVDFLFSCDDLVEKRCLGNFSIWQLSEAARLQNGGGILGSWKFDHERTIYKGPAILCGNLGDEKSDFPAKLDIYFQRIKMFRAGDYAELIDQT